MLQQISRLFCSALLTVTVVGTGVGVAQADQGAQRYPLVGPEANIYCTSLIPVDDSKQTIPGFVIFNVHDQTLTAVIMLRGAEPNATYPVRLLQSSRDGSDCFAVDGVLKTNAQGNGVLRISEPVEGKRAQVIVDTGQIFATPTYRATHYFVIS